MSIGFAGIIIAVVVLGILAYFVIIYNSLITLKRNIQKAFANIDVLLKQRFDELPKLVDTVKGYMKHEKSLLTEITRLRESAAKAQGIEEKASLNNQLTGALANLFARAEAYPQLKASDSFQQLQSRISAIENQIADRREFYNDSVNEYNIRIHSIPDVVIARMLAYQEEKLFQATESEKQDVKISF